jgi:peptidoglycan/xylan/chitin deacetylase (PgdA/CDA1 family)
MFHHFHDHVHPVGQGSISAEDFEKILLFIGLDRIVTAEEWLTNYRHLKNKICITFDDSLRCQYDIAKPVMDKYGIKAFFFVYSAVLKGSIEYLEVFRYFRSKYFKNFDDFFISFMHKVQRSAYKDEVQQALAQFNPDEYLKNFSFYTQNDKIFRFLRDKVLKVDRYNETLLAMIEEANIDLKEIAKDLWMSADQVKQLSREDHIIGLHSDTHPTTMALHSPEKQREEYSSNKRYLESELGIKVISMSHPCNSYTADTIEILKNLKVKMGFRANMESGFNTDFEIPREDHINVFKLMKESS